MGVITIISDWGYSAHYLASVKGAILSSYPQAVIIDISHDIQPFNILQTSFVLNHAYKAFPSGTVHIIGVNTEASIETPHVALNHEGHFFVGADNGIFSLMFEEGAMQAVELDVLQDSDYFTFSSRDVFAKAACHLAQGKVIGELGRTVQLRTQLFNPKPVTDKNVIKGNVIFVDSFENAITNIPEPLFREIGKGRPFNVCFNGYNDIEQIATSYNDVSIGEKLALFGSTGMLEISQNRANASSLLGLKINDMVRIEFHDSR